MNIEVYAVDTGSRNTIFHPKLYFAGNEENANIIIGSANLTFSGLHNNIEASTFIRLDLSNPADKKFAEEATNAFSNMLIAHPHHVFLIENEQQADELFNAGRVADEKVIPAPSPSSSVSDGDRDELPPMNLNKIIRPHKKSSDIQPNPVIVNDLSANNLQLALTAETVQPVMTGNKYLVWESKKLKERDLNIKNSPNTHVTGSMGFNKGAFDDIDQRHYFRENVFQNLNWNPDSKGSIERAKANFEFVIKNINHGNFSLEITHNTDTNSKTYKQNNMVTHLKWGDAKIYVAKHDLLDRVLYLYRKDTKPPEFMIEID